MDDFFVLSQTRYVDIDQFPGVQHARRSKDPAQREWVKQLPWLTRRLCRRWDIEIEKPLIGGATSVVFVVRSTKSGELKVLKIAPPSGHAMAQIRALELADGNGAVEVHAFDADNRAILMECLGRDLWDYKFRPERELAQLAESLKDFWRPVSDTKGLINVSDQLEFFEGQLIPDWKKAGQPCPRSFIEMTREIASELIDESKKDPHKVLLMGDPFPGNLLSYNNGIRWKWIDLLGFHGSREFDLGHLMRVRNDLLARSKQPELLLRDRCVRIAAVTETDPARIWRWGLVNRVSVGLTGMAQGTATPFDILNVSLEMSPEIPTTGMPSGARLM